MELKRNQWYYTEDGKRLVIRTQAKSDGCNHTFAICEIAEPAGETSERFYNKAMYVPEIKEALGIAKKSKVVII
jgi:hypothetical protein